jgi:site-specific recombinase XerD
VSNLRRIPYTKPLPADATVFTRKGERFARFKRRGKTVEAPLSEDGTRVRLLSGKWYGEYTDASGVEQCVPLCTDRTAAEQMLAAEVKQAERKRAGLGDPHEEHHKRPLLEHLEDYRGHLLAKGDTEEHAERSRSRARAVLEGCGFVFAPDLDAGKVAKFLHRLRQDPPRPELPPGEWFTRAQLVAALGIHPASVARILKCHGGEARGNGKARRYSRGTVEALQDRLCRGAGLATSNHYLTAVKGFSCWLAETDPPRTDRDRLASLKRLNADVDRRRGRRELQAEELRLLLAVTRDSAHSFRGLAGRDRYTLYATACGTGFRAAGLAGLTPERFDLDAETPTATLSARRNKSRVLKVQPLPPDLADLLKEYLRGKPAGVPVWPGTWHDRAAEMLRADLEAAGIPYEAEGPDGPLFADFHALRHTYLTLGGRAGIDLRTLQELAGYSTSALTERYSHRRLYDLAGAVEKMPNQGFQCALTTHCQTSYGKTTACCSTGKPPPWHLGGWAYPDLRSQGWLSQGGCHAVRPGVPAVCQRRSPQRDGARDLGEHLSPRPDQRPVRANGAEAIHTQVVVLHRRGHHVLGRLRHLPDTPCCLSRPSGLVPGFGHLVVQQTPRCRDPRFGRTRALRGQPHRRRHPCLGRGPALVAARLSGQDPGRERPGRHRPPPQGVAGE